MNNKTVETLIGAAVVAVAVVFVVFAYRTVGDTSYGGYQLTANISRVDGVALGTDVRLAGIKVGTVTALTLEPNYLVKVTMNIHNDVKIPDDSSLVVTSSSLLGSHYLSISPGGSDSMLKPGGEIMNTQGSVDIMGLIARFAGGVSGSGSSKSSADGDTP